MPRTFVAPVPAKINLGLEVTGRRDDGYHEIVTILQTISLYDRLVWTDTGKPFDYRGPTALSSGDLFRDALGTASDAGTWRGTLALEKAIPFAAGLGGGSSDAAAGLLLANPDGDTDSLHDLATRMGSDVPFFLRGGTALATGTGTVLEWLPTPTLWMVILTPPLEIPSKTATLYQSLSNAAFTDGSAVLQVRASLITGERPDLDLPNTFSHSLMEYLPVRSATDALRRAGAPWVNVSGAGPTVFTSVEDYTTASRIARRLPHEVGQVHIARTIPADHHLPKLQILSRLLRGAKGAR